MTRQEHLLTILIEECNELAQSASKALRFGMDDRHPEKNATNRENLINEFNDLLGMMSMLADEKILPNKFMDWMMVEAKKQKVEQYLKLSATLGTLTPERMKNLKTWVVEQRNTAHVNCLEERKEAYNHVLGYMEVLSANAVKKEPPYDFYPND